MMGLDGEESRQAGPPSRTVRARPKHGVLHCRLKVSGRRLHGVSADPIQTLVHLLGKFSSSIVVKRLRRQRIQSCKKDEKRIRNSLVAKLWKQ